MAEPGPSLPPDVQPAVIGLLEGAHLIVVALDAEGRLQYANPYLLKATGYTWEEVAGVDWFAVFVADDHRDRVRRAFSAIVDGQPREHLENAILGKEGRERIVYWNNTTLLDAEGTTLGTFSVGCDITEMRHAERQAQDALRELKHQKDALDEHSIVAVTDRQGRITYANDKFCEISQYTREELLGQDHRIVNSGYHPKSFMKHLWATIGRGSIWRGTVKNRAKGGMFYWVDTTIVPFKGPDGEIQKYVAIRTDITEKVNYQERLATLAAIVQSSQDGIVRESPDGTITSWNEAAETIYGFTPAEALGRPAGMIRGPEAVEGGPGVYETIHVGKGGRRIEVSVSEFPVRDAEGSEAGRAQIVRDITEKKQLERSLAQAAKLASLGELAGNIAHEVNNPIGIISGKARLLLTGGYDLPEKVERDLKKIAEQCDRVGNLTHSLLDYCRPSVNPRAPVDVHLPLEKALSLVESKAQRYSVKIVKELLTNPPCVSANSNELEQVFLNLALNAIDAMSKEGGELSVKTARSSGALSIVFQDSGNGIPDHVRTRIFEPFFTTKEGGKGTGLGLSVCYGIVTGIGGRISAESIRGTGTTFRIELPILSSV